MSRKKKAPRPSGLASMVPTGNYEARVSAGLTREERETLEAFLAAAPEHVPLAQGLGGARKTRWALSDTRRGKGEPQARGKRGGARVVYYYRRESHTVYLLDVYAKGDKEDLSAEDKRAIANAIQRIEAGARAESQAQGRPTTSERPSAGSTTGGASPTENQDEATKAGEEQP